MTKINSKYITLSQLLKIENIVSSGGEVKFFLLNNVVLVNNIKENRRGKKLYVGDEVIIDNKKYVIEDENQ